MVAITAAVWLLGTAAASASAPVACPAAGALLELVSSWAGLLDSTIDLPAVLRRERLDGEALALATPEQLHALGIPLGVALKIKSCFGSDSDGGPSAWKTVTVSGAKPLIIAENTTYPSTTDIVVTDGGTIELHAGATLTIHGSFNAPLQHVFNGSGRVLLNGDSSGRL